MKETILIVDDTPSNLQVLVGFLAGSGYQILVAEDGLAALEQLGRTRPDLILLDVAMPELDGFETCRRIKQLPEMKEVPVLFLTARTEMADKLTGFASGGVDYLTKPIQKEELIARVDAHLTILRQRRQVQSLLAQRERFMRIAAHDLRNLLTVITGFAQFGRTLPTPEQMLTAFDRIEKAGGSMQAIIDGFLSLQTVPQTPAGQPRTFDLEGLMDQIFEQSIYAAQSKGITLERQPRAGAPHALGALAQAHQMLTNYVSNAIKYSPRGTRVQVALERRGQVWRVVVRDEGPGIPPDERHKLFVEFAKISNKPTGGERSTGLGLAIVKALAEAQGGTVGAEFPAAGGSCFWFELPAAPAQG